MALGFLIVVWRRRLMLPFAMAVGLSAIAALIVPEIRDGIVDFLLRGQTEEDVASLTGRTDLYATALERLERISLGEGFRAARANLLDEENWGQGVSHAHNLVLEALISLGAPGAAAVLASLVCFGSYAVRVAWHPWYRRFGSNGPASEALAVFFPILAFCVLDSGFAMNANPFVIAFIFFAAKVRAQLLALRIATEAIAIPKASGSRAADAAS
jgi:O-antigen ligase